MTKFIKWTNGIKDEKMMNTTTDGKVLGIESLNHTERAQGDAQSGARGRRPRRPAPVIVPGSGMDA